VLREEKENGKSDNRCNRTASPLGGE
jgi:hypothetical protein